MCELYVQPITKGNTSFGFGAGDFTDSGKAYLTALKFYGLPATATPDTVIFAVQEFFPNNPNPMDGSPYAMVRCLVMSAAWIENVHGQHGLNKGAHPQPTADAFVRPGS